MKICILTSVHPAFDDRIFHKEARSLVRAGHEVVLVAPHERDVTRDGIRVIAVRKHRTRTRRMLLTPLAVLRKAWATRADVYHFHDPELIPIGVLLHRLGRRVIYDIHEYNADNILSKAWIPGILRRAISGFVGRIDRYAVRVLDASVVVNDDMVQMFERQTGRRRPIVAVHNYPDPRGDEADGSLTREPVAIYVGGLSRERGLEVLLAAGRRLKESFPDPRIRVLGPVDLTGVKDEYASRERWRAFGVDHAGVVDHIEVRKWLQRARLGLIPWLPTPNNAKGTPVKLFEYMLAGLPVVASDLGFIGRIVRETGCGILVPPGDAASLAEAIRDLLGDCPRADEMGRRGRAAVLARYNWMVEERELLALYARLAGA